MKHNVEIIIIFEQIPLDKMMINLDKALELLSKQYFSLHDEFIKTQSSISRVLSLDIYSPVDLPGFNKSLMDGFAYNSNDDCVKFDVVEVIPAGHIPEKSLNKGECSKIMTGAIVPQGANKIAKIEDVDFKDNTMSIIKKSNHSNICNKGDYIKAGDKLLSRGTIISYGEISSLYSIGQKEVKVYCEPKVGLITTGTELLSLDEPLRPGHVYDSNNRILKELIQTITPNINSYGIIKDDRELILQMIKNIYDNNDLIITSGGVSKGDYDYIPGILKELSYNIIIEKVAVKPGKPLIFAEKNGKYFFGLPGNPISSYFDFQMFVKPFIYKMKGYDYKYDVYKGKLRQKIASKEKNRDEFIPVMFDGHYIDQVTYVGSGHLNVLCNSNAFIKIDKKVTHIEKDSLIDVYKL